jgi:phosphatidylethanolamine-binding protein (PEBP) family uncharacterized protein
MVFDIPGNINKLDTNAYTLKENSFNQKEYGGPCPPNKPPYIHHYHFTLYAFKTKNNNIDMINNSQYLAKTKLIGLYGSKK